MTKAEHNEDRRADEPASRKGMKLVSFWVPDPNAPGFKEEARRQAKLLRESPDEAEALAFIEALGWPED